ncbi:molybdopterin-synthase adenylyltransferase MoeB [Aggregatibacter actinomycetemcomitans]|uniref:Molybdopterin-synthase adenylyltransferase n=1 Tax=Aggregatibacter actinomycetemcomitans TaxID=714 RepID=A0A5D0ELP8_AGGAC|nr:molybdopterin-synthase adenylyltransferase MoeB [Aggregatibacter actinomycetemcomitans]AFI87927.1 molybdopterin-synthase adenylyltransferase [Aggregatibacter actinomycetemcomitans D7S-1]KYK95727.1 molybdopterin-synthase adenylyltransferase [Aggregatibacter actinomycetemcomitans serotype d str. SA3733]AMQ94874.1 molybdopterin-synthase adenylyltransferase [Aggregatibacter actinomycetemcomitans]ANU82901.1 molybdopterin-synthase adenylyltransferase MoeB [Aggregatibacter actinomycetemcomitans]EK
MELTHQEELRYNRQIVLKNIDFDGQETLKDSKMLIVGLGGLGCAASQYLAVAGVGHLTLLDFDTVDISNLQRQVLHDDSRLGMPKVDSAKRSLARLNPHIEVDAINQLLDEQQLKALVGKFDVVLDCTDNVNTRNQLDSACAAHKIPLVSGAAIRMEGQVSVFTYEDNTPTYHSLSRLFGDNALSCVEAGVLAPIVGLIGSIQALEAIKVRLKIGTNLCGRLLLIDGMTMSVKEVKLTGKGSI